MWVTQGVVILVCTSRRGLPGRSQMPTRGTNRLSMAARRCDEECTAAQLRAWAHLYRTGMLGNCRPHKTLQ